MTTNTKPTRRSFLATVAAATAATALPTTTADARTPATWGALRAGLPGLRAAYLAEIERFAETLRPRFAAGELYGYREGLDDDGGADGMDAIEAAVREHFALEVTEETRGGWVWTEGGEDAYLILALSPSTEATDINGWNHVAHHATAAASWDVLNVARARGFYTPTDDEEPHPNHLDAGCAYCSGEARS